MAESLVSCFFDSRCISMPAGFRRHCVGKTLINVPYCDTASTRLVDQLMIIGRLSYHLIQFYLNNVINLRPLTPHIMSYYTHKMAIVL